MGLTAVEARAILRRYLRRFGTRGTAGADIKAGIVLGVESVPDGLAAGMLAGLNPLHGLYAYLFGTFAGALTTGAVFMSVQATGAMAVVVSDVDAGMPTGLSASGLATLVLLAGAVMLVLGIARLGTLVRFIPTAVLVGFINAVAVNIVLGQLDNATGRVAEGDNRVLRAMDSVVHVLQWNLPTVLVTVLTVALILVLERTGIGTLGMVVAVVTGSAAAWWINTLNTESVATIGDLTDVPRTLPGMEIPDLSLIPALVVPACSLALVGLVQGAAISGSIPNPDGKFADASADFRGQGIANIAAGLFQGMPVGGSMSATALVRTAGARSALANLCAAVVMALAILAAGPVFEYVAMPSLAGLLILVGIRTFKIHQILLVWRTGPVQATVLSVTFLLTLVVPLQYAALSGVGLAVILYVIRQSNRVVVKQWVFDDGEQMPRETSAPEVLQGGQTCVLVAYGSLFFAAAPVMESQLPEVPPSAAGAVVIIRLRGKDEIGSTFLKVLEGYSVRVTAAGGTIMVAGVSPSVLQQLRATGALGRLGEGRVFPERPRVGDSIREALDAANRWREGDTHTQ